MAAVEHNGYLVAWRRSRRYWHALGRPEIFNTDQGSQLRPSPERSPAPGSESLWTAAVAVHGAAMALAQIRGRQSQGLCRLPRGQAASPFGSHSTAADAHRRCTPMAVSRDGVTGALTHGCGHDGQRKSFAHMPTAATTAADGTHRSMISGGRSSRVSN